MNKQNFDINKLRVASPCPANWSEMRGDDKTRFCDLCSLNVYNFSEMTSEEIQKLITKSDGRICGRMYKRADGTILTQDCPVGIRAYYKRTARFAGAALTAIFGMFSISFAQADSKRDEPATRDDYIKIIKTKNQNQKSILSGTIFDRAGAVVPGVKISLTNKDKNFKTVSNEEGKYNIGSIPAGIYLLRAEGQGFIRLQMVDLEIKKEENTQLDIMLDASVIMGVIVSTEEPLIDTKSSGVTTKITREQMDKLPH